MTAPTKLANVNSSVLRIPLPKVGAHEIQST